MQLLFFYNQDMKVKETLIETLACQLSSTVIQLLFSFDQDMRVGKIFMQTLACQLSSTLMQLLFSFDQDMRVEKTIIETEAFALGHKSFINFIYLFLEETQTDDSTSSTSLDSETNRSHDSANSEKKSPIDHVDAKPLSIDEKENSDDANDLKENSTNFYPG